MPIHTISYRGEHGDLSRHPLLHSRLGSLSFGSRRAAEIYANSPNVLSDQAVDPRVIKAEISISKPVMNDGNDPFLDLFILEDILGRDKTLEIAFRHADHVEHTNNYEEIACELGVGSLKELIDHHPEYLGKMYLNSYAIFDDHEIVSDLLALGYDGAVTAGCGANLQEPEYRVFRQECIRIIEVEHLRKHSLAQPEHAPCP